VIEVSDDSSSDDEEQSPKKRKLTDEISTNTEESPKRDENLQKDEVFSDFEFLNDEPLQLPAKTKFPANENKKRSVVSCSDEDLNKPDFESSDEDFIVIKPTPKKRPVIESTDEDSNTEEPYKKKSSDEEDIRSNGTAFQDTFMESSEEMEIEDESLLSRVPVNIEVTRYVLF
jgi:hypothetical protein